MNDSELHKLVNRLSVQYFNKPFIDQVNFNSRLRTTGGRYLPSKRKIEINPKYLDELGMDELIGIIKHELVHYHLHIDGKPFKHRDRTFKELLKKTGSPRHCRALPSVINKELSYLMYKCTSCGHLYKRRRKVNINKYRCGRCAGKINFINKVNS